jgi:hypothetical protein
MIVYKDMTFCKSDCLNRKCRRFISEGVKIDAETWAKSCGLDEVPMSVADFSENCKEYKSPKVEVEPSDDGVDFTL